MSPMPSVEPVKTSKTSMTPRDLKVDQSVSATHSMTGVLQGQLRPVFTPETGHGWDETSHPPGSDLCSLVFCVSLPSK